MFPQEKAKVEGDWIRLLYEWYRVPGGIYEYLWETLDLKIEWVWLSEEHPLRSLCPNVAVQG